MLACDQALLFKVRSTWLRCMSMQAELQWRHVIPGCSVNAESLPLSTFGQLGG